MADSQIVQLLKYFQEKLKAHTFDVFSSKLNSNNVIIGETQVFDELSEDSFPRTELFIWKRTGVDEQEGYASRRKMVTLQLVGYIYRKKSNLTESDYYLALNYIEELENIVFGANADRAQGNYPCNGFYQIMHNPTMYMAAEIGEQITTVILEFEIMITKKF
ncbi:MAG: hypothetical protein ACTSXT_13780 [Candidatus Helarchaeota archaeon]